MGRKKVEMKRIEDRNSRQVTFSKRRGGLIKKARDLSVLCDVEVALLVFSGGGKLYEFCSGNSLSNILQRYRRRSTAEERFCTDGCGTESRFGAFRTSSELIQIMQRDLEEPYVDQLSQTDLIELEREIDATLIQIRSRKTQLMMQSIKALHEKERMLREENKLLLDKIAAIQTDGNIAIGSTELPNNYKSSSNMSALTAPAASFGT